MNIEIIHLSPACLKPRFESPRLEEAKKILNEFHLLVECEYPNASSLNKHVKNIITMSERHCAFKGIANIRLVKIAKEAEDVFRRIDTQHKRVVEIQQRLRSDRLNEPSCVGTNGSLRDIYSGSLRDVYDNHLCFEFEEAHREHQDLCGYPAGLLLFSRNISMAASYE
jgi:hypothetical protein